MSIFCRKNLHPRINTVLRVICINFFMTNPLLSCKYLVKMRQFCQNYTILLAIKVKSIPFFRFFTQKSALSWYFVKNVYSLKNTLLSRPYFVKKTYILSKTLCSHAIFFKFFNEKPPAAMSIFGRKKRKFCRNNIVWIMGQKSQWDAFFFRFFMKKSLFLYPYFVNITIRCQK